LITIGGNPVSQACTSLRQIEHPLAGVLGLLLPPPMPLGGARRTCDILNPPARAACVKRMTHPDFRLSRPRVDAGVVRDGIASVDVYRPAGHGKARLLMTIPVQTNVFAFVPGPRAYGALTVRFKDAGGRPVSATPLHMGTSKSTVVGIGNSGSSPTPSLVNVANIPLLQPPRATRYGRVTTRTKGRP
jgi:hypothetical protein